jgi:hypothetical protein
MKTETQHTPTPWHNESVVIPAQGGWIWTAPHGEIIATTFTHNIGEEVAAANAAFIVRAVNSHDTLIEAVSFALKFADMQAGKGNEPMPRQLVDALRAALAQAKKGAQ